MKTYLCVGTDYDHFDEEFKCDMFVEAENPTAAFEAWEKFVADEWDIDVRKIENPRVFEVPKPSTVPGEARVLCWHSDVQECVY